MSWGRLTKAIARVWLAICVSAIAPTHAQQTDVAAANRQALADAMGRILIKKVAKQPFSPAEVVGGTSDLNLDGFGEEFVYLAVNPCDGVDCGLFMFALIGDEYRESIGAVPGARISSPNSLINRKRNGYLDILFGTVEAGWDGSRYVDVASLPRSTLQPAAFVTACMAQSDNDYLFEQAGANTTSSREIVCRCEAQRFSELNLSQAEIDRWTRYLNEPDDGADSPDNAFDDLLSKVSDVATGCLADNGWSSWPNTIGADDAQQPQKPLVFDAFLQNCSAQDWLIGNRKIGTADRALGLCACLGRKLGAQGFDQTMLDQLISYYRADISESELDAIDANILSMHDNEANACLNLLPRR